MLCSLDPEITARFHGYLISGEHILWTGRPTTVLMFQLTDIVSIPFMWIWTLGAFSVFAAHATNGWLSPLSLAFSGMGLIFGLYASVGRFIIDKQARRRTVYAVTDLGVISLRELFGTTLDTQDITNLNVFEMKERHGGKGDIEFDHCKCDNWRRSPVWHPSLRPGLRFLRIRNVGEVYDLIAEAMVRRIS